MWVLPRQKLGLLPQTMLAQCLLYCISSVQSLSRVRLFATPWIASCQASLSITISQSSLRLTSIESVMPCSHILCHPLLLLPQIPPSISLFQWVNSSHEVAKVLEFQLPKKSQGWSPSEWTGWISLLLWAYANISFLWVVAFIINS